MAEIGPDPSGEVVAVSTRHGTQVEIDIDACGGACPAQSPARRRAVAVSIMVGGTANSRTGSQKERRESPFAV